MKLTNIGLPLILVMVSCHVASAQGPRLTISVTKRGDGVPRKVAVRPDGTVALSGDTFFHPSRAGIRVLDARGRLLRNTPPLSVVGSDPDSTELATGFEVALPDGGFLVIAGSQGLIRRQPDGSIDAAFSARFGTSDVYSAVLEPSGTVLVGGQFDSVPVVRITPDGSIDRSFRERLMTQGLLQVPTFGGTDSEGRILLMTNHKDGTPRELVRLRADGTRDPGFRPPDPSFGSFPAIWHSMSDGGILGEYGGCFNGGLVPSIEGVNRRGLARLNANGTLDTSFELDPSEFASFGIATGPPYPCLRSAVPLSDGRVYIALDWGREPDFSRSRGSIHRLQPNGRLDSTFRSRLDTHFVRQLVPTPDSKLLVLELQSDMWDEVPFTLKRLNEGGSVDSTFNAKEVEQVSAELLWATIGVFDLPGDHDYVLEASTDFVEWTTLQVIDSRPDGWFLDPGARIHGSRWYRLRRP